jgi:hypothetical protein
VGLSMFAALAFYFTTTATLQNFDYAGPIASALLHGHLGLETRTGSWLNEWFPTFTHALLPGSPAIDVAGQKFTPSPVYEQLGPGFDRVVNGRIDVGAFEMQPHATRPHHRLHGRGWVIEP